MILGLTVLELQNKLPKARVIYASATGASEPRNMAYMTRLGELWSIYLLINKINGKDMAEIEPEMLCMSRDILKRKHGNNIILSHFIIFFPC